MPNFVSSHHPPQCNYFEENPMYRIKYVSLKGKDSKKIFAVPLSHLSNGRSLKSSNVWSVRVHIFHIDQNVLYFTVNLFKSVSKQGPHIAFS